MIGHSYSADWFFNAASIGGQLELIAFTVLISRTYSADWSYLQRRLEDSAEALEEKARVAEEEASLLKQKANEVEREKKQVQLEAIKVRTSVRRTGLDFRGKAGSLGSLNGNLL